MSTVALQAASLLKKTKTRTILDVATFEARAGEVHVILGRSGAGKSTLLRTLALLEKPDGGDVLVAGKRARPYRTWATRRMATVLQSSPAWRGTVEWNVGYGLRVRSIGRRESLTRIDDALELVGLSEFKGRQAETLSGGEAQRVALARALAVEPEILFLDEPLAHVDEPFREDLSQELRRFTLRTGCATVWVTHDRAEALSVGDQISVIEDGKLLQQANAADVFTKPASEQVARLVGADNVIAGRIVDSTEGLATISAAALTMVAATPLATGTDVLVLVRPEEVSLWSKPPEEPSPRNRFQAEVHDVVRLGALAKVYMKVTAGSPGNLHQTVELVAAVTLATARELDLTEGSEVWAGFKATSAHVIPRVLPPFEKLAATESD